MKVNNIPGRFLPLFFIFFFCSVPILIPTTVGGEEKVYTVSGRSMEPALYAGDRIAVELDYYHEHPVRKGDLAAILFKNQSRPLVKRVAAVPGDRVEIREKVLWINGKAHEPKRLMDAEKWNVTLRQLRHYGWIIPPKSFLVLGDNPENSRDSKRLGLISVDHIHGKVVRKF